MSFIHSGLSQGEGDVTGVTEGEAEHTEGEVGHTEGEAEHTEGEAEHTEGEVGHTEGEAGDSETSEATVLYSSKFDLLH